MTTYAAGPTPRPDPHPDPSTPAAPAVPRRTLRVREPADVLAAVPVVLGFEPADSVVMLTAGGQHAFHARVDLPLPGPGLVADAHETALVLAEPAVRHEVSDVALAVYGHDEHVAGVVGAALREVFADAGIEVRLLLRADGRRFHHLAGPRRGVPVEGVPYDVGLHPFRVQAVADGQVTHASRADLAATLAPDPPAGDRVLAALGSARPVSPTGLAEAVARHVAARTEPDDAEVASWLLGLRDVAVRDAAWGSLERDDALEHVRLWTGVVRRSPGAGVASPAAVLAFAAWAEGDGALAWCAVDRSVAADPTNSLARLVSDLLVAAVPPTTWSPARLAGPPPGPGAAGEAGP